MKIIENQWQSLTTSLGGRRHGEALKFTLSKHLLIVSKHLLSSTLLLVPAQWPVHMHKMGVHPPLPRTAKKHALDPASSLSTVRPVVTMRQEKKVTHNN